MYRMLMEELGFRRVTGRWERYFMCMNHRGSKVWRRRTAYHVVYWMDR